MAFTLAETLIVMGIIGVVAALTLPNLNSSTGDKEKVAKVKKIYSNLNDAMGRAIAVYGPYSEWASQKLETNPFQEASMSTIMQRMSDFLKISKSCSNSDTSNCIDFNIPKGFNPILSGEGVLLADGTGLWIEGLAKGVDVQITVDIDGPKKGPNIFGKDKFYFIIDKDTGEIYPRGYNDLTDITIINSVVKNGYYAAAWIMQYDNADYLKTDSSGKCTNNTSIVLSTTNTTCR
ncbi:type II secretion system protein [bacterium]|nr:type II secretion system protein [bacterium]